VESSERTGIVAVPLIPVRFEDSSEGFASDHLLCEFGVEIAGSAGRNGVRDALQPTSGGGARGRAHRACIMSINGSVARINQSVTGINRSVVEVLDRHVELTVESLDRMSAMCW